MSIFGFTFISQMVTYHMYFKGQDPDVYFFICQMFVDSKKAGFCKRYTYIYIYIALLTECEVCTGKYLAEVFVCGKKTEGKYFPVQIEQTRLIDIYYMAFGSFSSLFIALCVCLQMLPFTLTLHEFLCCASCLHSLGIHLPRL